MAAESVICSIPLARLTLRLDVAIGNKRPNEDRSTGFYISFNEAF
jgi:hypothetical protein